MFSRAAPKYWSWYCHVGGGSRDEPGKLHGLGCRVAPRRVLTAAHVFGQYDFATVLLTDGLWRCSVVKAWPDLDLALLRADLALSTKRKAQEPLEFPLIATKIPTLGTFLGYIGWLKLTDDSGRAKGRTYFGQGHVAFVDEGDRGQTLIAVDGSAVEQGFSGGPAFTADGTLCGVLVEALQYAPHLSQPLGQVNALPFVSPVAPISRELPGLLREA
jgi:S1-C subfamily serine protease